MVFVQHVGGFVNVNVIGRGLAPGQGHDPVQIGANYNAFERGEWHLFQTFHFAQGAFAGGFGHFRRVYLFAIIVEFPGFIVALAQFLLNSFHLFAQDELALRVAHFLFHAVANVLLNIENLALLFSG